MSGKVILLHGTSSSGKSTIARALQAAIDEPFLHYSIDHLRDAGGLPTARIAAGDFEWSAMRASFFDGFHRSVGGFVAAGNNLILEHILDTDGWLDQLVGLLAEADVFFVGVRCSVAELKRREMLRGDRKLGSAEADFDTIHRGVRYDLEVSTEVETAAVVSQILAAWQSRTANSVFARLAQRGGPAVWRGAPSVSPPRG